ncbi:MAG: hypothetical protein F7B19_04260 [Desulfurococcales archaeon]|nr:hypothetical protein [Desulfurococcales archaeon]
MGRKLSEYFGEGGGGFSRKSMLDEKEVKKIVEMTVAEFLEPILKELREIKESLKRIEDKLNNIGEVEPLQERRRVKGGSQRALARDPTVRRIIEVIKRDGYIYASEARVKVGINGFQLLNLARRLQLVTIDLDGDYCIMTQEEFDEFRDYLNSIDTSDPEEAANLMGRYRDLFTRLRRIGSVYFDSSSRSWKLLK